MKKQRKKKLIAAVIVAFVSLLIFGYIKFFNGTFIFRQDLEKTDF